MTASILETVSVTDALAAALRTQILDGQWEAGAQVAEVEVARRFSVSRPTAKGAIRTLVHEGLLRQHVHHAPFVPRLSTADLADLYFVRVPLELTIVERLALNCAAGQPAAELTDAQAAIDQLSALADHASASTFVAADLRFHTALAEATASPRTRRTYAVLAGEIHLSMVQTRQALGRDRIVREHAQILQAIRRGDSVRAVNSARRHLAGALKALS